MTRNQFNVLSSTTIPSKNTVNLQQILISRHYLLETPIAVEDAVKSAYYNAYLFANFGIIVDKPKLLSELHVKEISDLFRLDVPASFYKNPQDTKYYTSGELFVNQVISYFLAYGEENSAIDLFADEKKLPEHPVGSDIKVREFKILSAEEADEVLTEIVKAYCDYKRPWSLDETAEFTYLYDRGYYKDYDILCGDNAVVMLERDITFAKHLYKKDLVKLSIARCGEKSKLVLDANTKDLIRGAIPLVKDCPMTKKQAKYFNTLVHKVGADGKVKLASNTNSPYARAQAALDKGDVLGAAKIYAANGSLFERNIKYLMSRANPAQALEIVKMIPAKNPVALYQFVSTLMADDGGNRTFTFTKNKLVKKHKETEYEAKWRKSRLNDATRKMVHDVTFTQIEAAYRAQPSLGKVYVSPDFFKVGVPVNTSASGKGIDVLPVGSRIPVRCDNVRTFVHWEHAFDIDSSLIIVHDNGTVDCEGWFSYHCKRYAPSILFSGDITGPNGTEYFDIASLKDLRLQGIRYLVQTFHGYCSNLDSGEIYCGYNDISNLNSKAWDPKNIELKIHVKGDTRACIGFAIDLETSEVIILNQMIEDDARVVNASLLDVIGKYLQPGCLELNMGLVASYRASDLVFDPRDADVVFDTNYKPMTKAERVAYEQTKLAEFASEAADYSRVSSINIGINDDELKAQKVIRPFDVEKLAVLASGGSLE